MSDLKSFRVVASNSSQQLTTLPPQMWYSQRRPLRLSAKVTVPLSIIMVTFACLALVPHVPRSLEPPLFTSTRVAEVRRQLPPLLPGHQKPTTNSARLQTGNHFMEVRQKEAPAWLYQGLHALPAILWSVAMPFQHIASLRRKFPAFHRRTGYFVLTGSLGLSLTGYTLLVRDIAHSHEDPWHLHDFNGVSPVGWPTFEASLWALGPVYLLTLYKTAATARRRDLKAHERWAAAHTISAYVISLERLFIALSYVVGFVLATRVDKEWLLKALNDLPDTVAAKAELEMDMFALANVGAFLMAFCWAGYAWTQAGRFGVPGLSSNGEDIAKGKKAR